MCLTGWEYGSHAAVDVLVGACFNETDFVRKQLSDLTAAECKRIGQQIASNLTAANLSKILIDLGNDDVSAFLVKALATLARIDVTAFEHVHDCNELVEQAMAFCMASPPIVLIGLTLIAHIFLITCCCCSAGAVICTTLLCCCCCCTRQRRSHAKLGRPDNHVYILQ